jgi:hypothetical protein
VRVEGELPALGAHDQGVERECPFAQCRTVLPEPLRGRGVGELEWLATSLWVTQDGRSEASVQERAEALNELKPHVSVERAAQAVEEIDRLRREAGAFAVHGAG